MANGTPLPQKAQDLLDLWQTKKGENRLPLKTQFDPFVLKPWLGYLLLIEVCDGGADFYHRLNGSALRDELGFDWTGSKLSEMPKTLWPLMEEYRTIVAGKEPHFNDRAVLLDRPHIQISKLILPLSKDGEAVDFLLINIYPLPEGSGEKSAVEPVFAGV